MQKISFDEFSYFLRFCKHTARIWVYLTLFMQRASPPTLELGGASYFLENFFMYLSYWSEIFGGPSGKVKTSSTEKMKCVRDIKNFLRTFEKKVWTKKQVNSRFFGSQISFWKDTFSTGACSSLSKNFATQPKHML